MKTSTLRHIRNYLAVASVCAFFGAIGGAQLRGLSLASIEKGNIIKAQDAISRIEHCKVQYVERFIVNTEHYRALKTSERDQERFTNYLALNMEIGSALCRDFYWNKMIFEKNRWFSLPEVIPEPVIEKPKERPAMSKEMNYTPRTVYETIEEKLKSECKGIQNDTTQGREPN